MLVGENAKLALSSAKVLERWRELESLGLAKIDAEPETEPDSSFYDMWEHLSDRTRDELKERYCDDCWQVTSWHRADTESEWEFSDSIGNCAGYADVTSPFENAYVIDLMASAIRQREECLSALSI
jgi:hypothetical protein